MLPKYDNTLCIRLKGGRFNDGIIPATVLPSFAQLERLVAEIAWQEYVQETGKKRGKKAFKEAMALGLTEVNAGSAVATFKPIPMNPMLRGLDHYDRYRNCGVEQVHRAVTVAGRGQDAGTVLKPALLAMFDNIMPDLRDDESVEFPASTGPTVDYAAMTVETRNCIIQASKTPTVVKMGGVYAFVTEINKRTGSFELQPVDGSTQKRAKFQDAHFNALRDAWETYRRDLSAGNPVLVLGEMEFGQFGSVRKVNKVDAIETLDPLDVRSRLLYISSLRDGWFNGSGSKFEPQYLVTLADRFDKWFPTELGNPAIFPHVEGTIGCEWTLPRGECILTVDPQSDKGEWIDFSLENENDTTERTLRLGEESEWKWLSGRVAARTAGGSR